jgi:hypothetical protein
MGVTLYVTVKSAFDQNHDYPYDNRLGGEGCAYAGRRYDGPAPLCDVRHTPRTAAVHAAVLQGQVPGCSTSGEGNGAGARVACSVETPPPSADGLGPLSSYLERTRSRTAPI